MNDTNLLLLVESTFSWLSIENPCSFVCQSEGCIDIAGDKFMLRLRAGGVDLPTLHFVDHEKSREIDLWEEFCRFRRSQVEQCFIKTPEVATIAERKVIMISVLSCALRCAGKDILSGMPRFNELYGT